MNDRDCENCEDCKCDVQGDHLCEGRVECECGRPECPEPCENMPMIGAEMVFLNMKTEDGQESKVSLDQVIQTVWSILMDIDRRLCELEKEGEDKEGEDKEEESRIILST
jgi:hypothetical protein